MYCQRLVVEVGRPVEEPVRVDAGPLGPDEKAVGHQEFCHCISENMPADQEFANYVVAVSKTKNELNFDELSDYYQQSIDLARTARDKCVTETM